MHGSIEDGNRNPNLRLHLAFASAWPSIIFGIETKPSNMNA
jgi:hypothetical protein